MRRAEADVFTQNTLGPEPMDLPPPGPTSAWSAEGVISVLSGMALPDRLERMSQVLAARSRSVTVVLDNPYDPHNISAVFRTCDAFGIQDVHVLGAKERLPAASKITKGSHQWIDVYQHPSSVDGVRRLKAAGYQLLVTHPEGELLPSELSQIPRLGLVFGNEHEGVSDEVRREVSGTVRIAMRGFVESLNLSVSAAILLHAAMAGRSPDLSPEAQRNLLARWLRSSVPRSTEILAAFDAR